MTIKHTGKNISAESENVITDVTFNEATGVLTFYQKNFYDGSTTSFSRDLSGVQLGVVKLADQNALNTLKNDSTKEDYKKSHLFLVPLSGNNTEGVFAEYVYVETSTNVWDFERLGSTELNLSNYIQKSQTNGLIKNDGTIDRNTYLTQHQDLSGKADAVHNHTSNDITDMDTVTITVTYTDNTTDTLTLFKQISNS